MPSARCAACHITLADGRRAVVVASHERYDRYTLRTAELVARTKPTFSPSKTAFATVVSSTPASIGRAAQRILGASGVARLFDLEIADGRFLFHYNDVAFAYQNCSPAATSSSPHSPPPKPPPPK